MQVSITDVCDFQGGTQPPKSEWSAIKIEGYIRMLQIRDFTQKKESFIEYVKNKKTLKTCEEKDILIGRYGASIGKILTGLSGAYNVAIVKTIPDVRRLDRSFLLHLLKGDAFQRFILNIGSRAAQAGFNKKELEKFRFNLPSLDQQQKIAEILDAADALRQKDQQLIDHYTALSQSLFLDMFGDPVSNTMSWSNKKIDNVCKFVGGGTPSRKNMGFYSGSIPWVTSKDMKGTYLYDAKEHITSEAIQKSSTKLVPKNTLLIVVKSKILMHTLPVLLSKTELCFNQDIKAIVPDSSINVLYLLLYFKKMQSVILRKARGVNTEGLTLNHLKPLDIPIPPIELQNQFADRIGLIEQQKQQAEASLAQSNNLFNSLLQKAFTGELTQQSERAA